MEQLRYHWRFWARPKQIMPGPKANPQTEDGHWRNWLILAGRGFGKTKTGAECVKEWVYMGRTVCPRVALVGPTRDDIEKVMVTGESTSTVGSLDGLLNIFPPNHRPLYLPSKNMIRFHTGAVGQMFTSEKPERLRGPQNAKAWCDEFRAWQNPQATWDMLEFNMRQGSTEPQVVITTTGKPTKLLKSITQDPETIITVGSTYENAANLNARFLERIKKKYEGTRLGKQELQGLILSDVEGALWNFDLIEDKRVGWAPDLWRICVGVDPTVAGRDRIDEGGTDECGIVVTGRAQDNQDYVLGDYSIKAEPTKWAYEAVRAYHDHKADVIVAEGNNGGEMVRQTILNVDPLIPVVIVNASRGKYTRAEPHALRYDQGHIHHVGQFEQLEDEMCTWEPNGKMASPNRLDALVWALFALGENFSTGTITFG